MKRMLLSLCVTAFAVSCSNIVMDAYNERSGSDESGTWSKIAVTIDAIPGVVVPVRGETPVTTAIETDQYTGTITWSPGDSPFAQSTVYTATIVLTPKTRYTLKGVAQNFFTVAGATSVTNDADSGTVTAVFPATGLLSDVDVVFQSAVQVGGTTGTADTTSLTLNFDVDPSTLAASNITVTGATKGALSGSGTTRSIAISSITVANAGSVTVTITSPSGYAITGSPQTAAVYRLLTIGMDYLGGKIAYILQSGDSGYNASVPHGIIAAESDQSTSVRWIMPTSIHSTALSSTTYSAIGQGSANTDIIIAAAAAAGWTTSSEMYAARLARDYGGGGYSDWFLPSRYELSMLYTNRAAIGGFSTGHYWASTEQSNGTGSVVNFSNGYAGGGYSKNAYLYVRACRYF